MEKDEIIIVAGLGRCGTTLMCRLLHNAGLETYSKNLVSYESDDTQELYEKDNHFMMDRVTGKVIKLIDLHRLFLPPAYRYRVIWMQRDHKQQAKSHIKWIKHLDLAPFNIGTDRYSLKTMMDRDTVTNIKKLERLKIPYLRVCFENLINLPKLQLPNVANFVGLQPEKLMECGNEIIIKRDTACAPDLSIELMYASRYNL